MIRGRAAIRNDSGGDADPCLVDRIADALQRIVAAVYLDCAARLVGVLSKCRIWWRCRRVADVFAVLKRAAADGAELECQRGWLAVADSGGHAGLACRGDGLSLCQLGNIHRVIARHSLDAG